MTEHDEQAAVVDYLHLVHPDVLFWSNMNGMEVAGRTIGQKVARINSYKRTGMLPGVSDLIIFEPRGGYSAMFLEMKKPGGRLQENQQWFLREVESNGRGGYGAVAYGRDEAIDLIEEYLSWQTNQTPMAVTTTISTTA